MVYKGSLAKSSVFSYCEPERQAPIFTSPSWRGPGPVDPQTYVSQELFHIVEAFILQKDMPWNPDWFKGILIMGSLLYHGLTMAYYIPI